MGQTRGQEIAIHVERLILAIFPGLDYDREPEDLHAVATSVVERRWQHTALRRWPDRGDRAGERPCSDYIQLRQTQGFPAAAAAELGMTGNSGYVAVFTRRAKPAWPVRYVKGTGATT